MYNTTEYLYSRSLRLSYTSIIKNNNINVIRSLNFFNTYIYMNIRCTSSNLLFVFFFLKKTCDSYILLLLYNCIKIYIQNYKRNQLYRLVNVYHFLNFNCIYEK